MSKESKPDYEPECHAPHMKIPEDPEIFIAILESRFQKARISCQQSKYNKLFSAIPASMIPQIRDIVMNLPDHDPHDTLRGALIKRVAASEEKRIHHVLSEIHLGDTTQAQLLRKMRLLGGTTYMDDAVLRRLWMQRLPPYAQGTAAVLIQGQTLDKCVEAADMVLEQTRTFTPQSHAFTKATVTPPDSVVNPASTTAQHNASSNNSDIQMLCQEVRRLMQVVEQHETTINSLRPTFHR